MSVDFPTYVASLYDNGDHNGYYHVGLDAGET